MNKSTEKVKWVGDSRVQVRNFPKAARKAIGDALNSAQLGYKPPNAKPLKNVGSGVLQITTRYDTNTYRAVYTVKLGQNIYVLHAFQKKSTRGISTPKREIDLIKQRLKMAIEMEAENE